MIFRLYVTLTAVFAVQRPHMTKRGQRRTPPPIGELKNPMAQLSQISRLPLLNGANKQILSSQPIPPKFKNSPAAALFPSFLEISSPVHFLHALTPDARHDAEASADAETSATVDFPGNCHNFVPMAGLSQTRNLNECWDACKNFQFCTQVHFVKGKCFLAQGISYSFGARLNSDGFCRSLTDLGMVNFLKIRNSQDLALPSFAQLPSEDTYTLVQPKLESSQLRVTTPSFFLCQSSCLDKTWCRVAVWLDVNVSGNREKICMFGSAVVFGENQMSHEKCEKSTCVKNVCSGQTCLIAEKNPGDFGKVPVSLKIADDAIAAEEKICECVTPSCTTSCLRESEISCMSLCSNTEGCRFAAVQQNLGKVSCFLSTSAAVAHVHDKLDFSFFARPETLAISKPMTFAQSTALPGNVQKLAGGSCKTFHPISILPNAAFFTAASADECWSLCSQLSSFCTQVEYNPTGLCVLGDAIATKTNGVTDGTQCLSLMAPPDQVNGLPGFIVSNSIIGTQPGFWFPNAAPAVLANSLEECQNNLQISTEGNARFGGFLPCSSVNQNCASSPNHPDCALCSSCTTAACSSGVCRISSSTPSPALACLGDACEFFEISRPGYLLKPGRNAISTSGLLCSGAGIASASPDCSFAVDSLWTCQNLCNQNPGCVAGLYTNGDAKTCTLSTGLNSTSSACSDCAFFESAGLGHPVPLSVTGTNFADWARGNISQPMMFDFGACQTLKMVGNPIAIPLPLPAGDQPHEFCMNACKAETNCVAIQLQGYQNSGKCSLGNSTWSQCDTITCVLSSVITDSSPDDNDESFVCLSYTASPVLGLMASPDLGNFNLGIPAYSLFNNRMKRFSYANTANSGKLLLTRSLEDCQSQAKSRDYPTGTWQPCPSMAAYCQNPDGTPTAAVASNPTSELATTCQRCLAVNVSSSQPSVPFAANWGVCKYGSVVETGSTRCVPEPCFSFEGGNDDFDIISQSISPFLDNNGQVRGNILMGPGILKTATLGECEEKCIQAKGCLYGHYEPATAGAGNCYLTAQEARDGTDGARLCTPQVKGCAPSVPIANACTAASCIVFAKII